MLFSVFIHCFNEISALHESNHCSNILLNYTQAGVISLLQQITHGAFLQVSEKCEASNKVKKEIGIFQILIEFQTANDFQIISGKKNQNWLFSFDCKDEPNRHTNQKIHRNRHIDIQTYRQTLINVHTHTQAHTHIQHTRTQTQAHTHT